MADAAPTTRPASGVSRWAGRPRRARPQCLGRESDARASGPDAHPTSRRDAMHPPGAARVEARAAPPSSTEATPAHRTTLRAPAPRSNPPTGKNPRPGVGRARDPWRAAQAMPARARHGSIDSRVARQPPRWPAGPARPRCRRARPARPRRRTSRRPRRTGLGLARRRTRSSRKPGAAARFSNGDRVERNGVASAGVGGSGTPRRRVRRSGASRTEDSTRAKESWARSFAPRPEAVAPWPTMERRAAVVHSPAYHCDIGPHVFPVEKFGRVRRALVESGDVRDDQVLEPGPASPADLELVHTRAYLDDLRHLRWTRRTACSELPLTIEIVEAYILAAGGTTLASREALRLGAAVNLGGGFHHAFAEQASGFCYINDLAVAIRVIQRDGLVRRAAVVDCDLHQGNGTAHLFRSDPDVFTFSIHQEHLYPIKEQSDLDIGLDNGTGDEEFNRRLAAALPRVWEHRPELVLYQAGADPYEDDQLGALRLTIEGLKTRDALVLEGCATRGIPVVVTLGGGYARQVADTVRIHRNTCALALALAARGATEPRRDTP